MNAEAPLTYVSKTMATEEAKNTAFPVSFSSFYFSVDFQGLATDFESDEQDEIDAYDAAIARSRQSEPVCDLEDALRRIKADE